jgi:type II secretory pathway component PulM
MGIQERIEGLEPRERRLLGILLGMFVVMLLLLIPVGISAALGDKTHENEQIREAITRLEAASGAIAERKAERDAVLERYAKPAPALAGYLDSAASAAGIAIPEIKDKPPTPHGKKYEERATAISLKKVGLVGLVKFMERVSTGTYPIAITALNVRKRGVEPDSYDVEMTVSAFHRIEPKVKEKPKATAEESDRAVSAEEENP